MKGIERVESEAEVRSFDRTDGRTPGGARSRWSLKVRPRSDRSTGPTAERRAVRGRGGVRIELLQSETSRPARRCFA